MRTAILLSLLLLLALPCCDDDDNGGFKPEPIYRELTSPENVLHNLAACHNEMDYEHFVPLIHDAFSFVLWPDDIPDIPAYLHQNGIWYKAMMLHTVRNMLDTSYVPEYMPELKVEGIEASITLSGDLKPSPLTGSPVGSLYGRGDFDLQVETTSGTLFIVHSRPVFYFAPDSTAAEVPGGVTWSIWRIEDAPPSGNSNLRASQGSAAPLPPEPPSWGKVLSLYASRTN